MMVKLLGIEHDGPVRVIDKTLNVGPVHEFGVFEPKDFDALVAFINRNGGTTFWEVRPV